MLVNFNKMLKNAKDNNFAIPHFNINNLEWIKYILEKCNDLNIPVILGVSEGAVRYMGGYSVVSAIVKELMLNLKIDIPVCLHLDHGSSFSSCKAAIDAGFTSVMIDASKYNIQKNIEITKSVVEYAHNLDVSVEAEIGHIGGEEDNSVIPFQNATLEDCKVLYENTLVDALAPALGSVHGFYKGEPNIDYSTMRQISDNIPIPLVLHGGTGLTDEQIKKSISSGISKININTDLQAVWNKAVRKFIVNNPNVYDPRKIISSGQEAIKERIEEIVTLFGTKI